MKKNQGLAVIPLIIVIVLVGVAGFAIFSWVKTNNQAAADKEVAEQREEELKAVLEDAQQEAEENAEKAAQLGEKLTKTEEAMALAEQKAKEDAEEKAAMIAELEEKFAAEETAKTEAEEKSAALAKEIASLEESIEEANERAAMLRAGLSGGAVTRINPRATAGLASIADSLQSQKDGISKIKALLANADGPIAASELEALIRSFESGLVDAERSAAGLKDDLVKSGEFSSSSSVGQAIADLQQTTMKQRSIVNSLKAMLANSGETIDPIKVKSMIADLESSISELEQRQASLDNTVSAAASASSGDGASSAIEEFQRQIKAAQSQVVAMKRQLAASEAEKNAAIQRQEELEKLSIEIKYDIDYKVRSLSYGRRLHSLYNQMANPSEER